jgi:hypothetical protein
MSNTKGSVWDFDLRIRDRNLKQGLIDTAQLTTHLAALPDLEAQVESFVTAQPMFENEEDDFDDEEDDETADVAS